MSHQSQQKFFVFKWQSDENMWASNSHIFLSKPSKKRHHHQNHHNKKVWSLEENNLVKFEILPPYFQSSMFSMPIMQENMKFESVRYKEDPKLFWFQLYGGTFNKIRNE